MYWSCRLRDVERKNIYFRARFTGISSKDGRIFTFFAVPSTLPETWDLRPEKRICFLLIPLSASDVVGQLCTVPITVKSEEIRPSWWTRIFTILLFHALKFINYCTWDDRMWVCGSISLPFDKVLGGSKRKIFICSNRKKMIPLIGWIANPRSQERNIYFVAIRTWWWIRWEWWERLGSLRRPFEARRYFGVLYERDLLYHLLYHVPLESSASFSGLHRLDAWLMSWGGDDTCARLINATGNCRLQRASHAVAARRRVDEEPLISPAMPIRWCAGRSLRRTPIGCVMDGCLWEDDGICVLFMLPGAVVFSDRLVLTVHGTRYTVHGTSNGKTGSRSIYLCLIWDQPNIHPFLPALEGLLCSTSRNQWLLLLRSPRSPRSPSSPSVTIL